MADKITRVTASELDSYVRPFRIDGSKPFHLKLFRHDEDGELEKNQGKDIIEANRKRLSDLQEKLYAQNCWSLLLIFQGATKARTKVLISR